mgnify:CR=1 FL=1
MKKINMHIRGVIRGSSPNVIATPRLVGARNLYSPHRDCFGWLSQPRNDRRNMSLGALRFLSSSGFPFLSFRGIVCQVTFDYYNGDIIEE